MAITCSVEPQSDQVEVTLFGPGYGESAVLHLGNNNWVVVDSCIDSNTGQPAAIPYLEGLGVDPSTAVKLVVATHWHDDHIGGMGALVSRCAEAKFCCSAALGSEEFCGYVRKFQPGTMIAGGSGVREIDRVIKLLSSGSRVPVAAHCNKLVFRLPAEESGHGRECSVWTLSPSDAQFQKSLFEIGSLVFKPQELKHRAIEQPRNHLSVVTWVGIGETAILLGADLEETSARDTGWSVIVASDERPSGKASVYKVAHHGSATGHSDDVWRTMLVREPFALLTPWSLGRKLPTAADVDRIVALTPNAYSAAKLRSHRARSRLPAVEKTVKERRIKVRHAEPPTGGLRLREDGGTDGLHRWKLDLLRHACHLSEVHA
jgi:Metallo-beta-lactamase superfamily